MKRNTQQQLFILLLRVPKILKPLSDTPDFRWLFASQFTNNLGMFLDYMALISLVVYTWNKGPKAVAGITIVYAFPMIISPFAGALVDKWPLRKIMFISSIISAMLTLSIIFINGIEILIFVIFLRAFTKIFYYPAEISVIKSMFKKDELLRANSLVQGVFQVFRILGPITGGCLLLFLAPEAVFIITAISYLISSFFLFLLPRKYDSTHIIFHNKYSMRIIVEDIIQTIRIFFHNYKLLFSFMALTIATLAFFLSESMITLFAKALGFSCSSFEWVFVAIGAGGVLGAIMLGEKRKEANLILLMLVGIGTMGICMFVSAIVCPLTGRFGTWLFLILWFFTGIGISYATIPYSVLIMKEVSADMIGKASTMSSLSCGLALLTAPFIGACIAKRFNIYVPFLLTGVCLMAAFGGLLYFYYKNSGGDA